MIKTYEIDLDDALVDSASSIFETLGTDIDSAIKLFLTQATLKKGFPFAVVIPEEEDDANLETKEDSPSAVAEENAPAPEKTLPVAGSEELHGGITEEEENAFATVGGASVPPASVSPEVAVRVAANEALVAEMRNEIGDKAVTPEFDENDDDGTHGNYEAMPEANETPAETELASEMSEPRIGAENVSEVSETLVEAESAQKPLLPSGAPEAAPVPETTSSDEDEDETTPDNLFDAWDVGEEEDIGCR